MKSLGKLKLNQVNKEELAKREMNVIKGGHCVCGCVNNNYTANGNANAADNLHSPGGGTCFSGYYVVYCEAYY